MRLADEVRDFALEHWVKPARLRGLSEVNIRAGDVHDRMGLSHRHPAVCSALETKAFSELAGVALISRSSPVQGANAQYTFRLLEANHAPLGQ